MGMDYGGEKRERQRHGLKWKTWKTNDRIYFSFYVLLHRLIVVRLIIARFIHFAKQHLVLLYLSHYQTSAGSALTIEIFEIYIS